MKFYHQKILEGWPRYLASWIKIMESSQPLPLDGAGWRRALLISPGIQQSWKRLWRRQKIRWGSSRRFQGMDNLRTCGRNCQHFHDLPTVVAVSTHEGTIACKCEDGYSTIPGSGQTPVAQCWDCLCEVIENAVGKFSAKSSYVDREVC